MPDDRAPWESAFASSRPDPSAEELAELRELLLGPERRRLKELERRLDAVGVSGDELAELLPEAIVLRSGRDRQLARALAPTIERGDRRVGPPEPARDRERHLPRPRSGHPEGDRGDARGAGGLDQQHDRAQPLPARPPLAAGGVAHRRSLRADRPQARPDLSGRAGVPDPRGDRAAAGARVGAGAQGQRLRS